MQEIHGGRNYAVLLQATDIFILWIIIQWALGNHLVQAVCPPVLSW